MLRLALVVTGLLGLADAAGGRHYTRGSVQAHRKNAEVRLPDLRERELPFESDDYAPPMRVEFVSWDPRYGAR